MSVRVKVGFDHTGEDGKKRVPGQVITVSDEEYTRRGPKGDGFMREVGNATKGTDDAPAAASSAPAAKK